MKKLISRTFICWLPLSVAVVCIYGVLFYVVQQNIRLTANEVPAQYAEELIEKLEGGLSPVQAVNGLAKIDMHKSLFPFVMIYDSLGKPVEGTGMVCLAIPAPSLAALRYADSPGDGENRITWQLGRVRMATIIRPSYIIDRENNTKAKCYVLAGHSFIEFEARIDFAFLQISVGALITLIATFVATFIVKLLARPSTVINST